MIVFVYCRYGEPCKGLQSGDDRVRAVAALLGTDESQARGEETTGGGGVQRTGPLHIRKYKYRNQP